jgi:hypothetical protein
MTYVLAPNQTVQTFPYSIRELRRDNPNTSFPQNPSNEFLESWNVFVVQNRSAPSFDPATENCNQVNPTLDNGEWVTTWQVTSASADEIAERLQEKSSEIREQRNQLLTDCDWTQLTDSPLNADVKTSWATYRQQLRDVTSQTGFPWNVQWPSAPS